MTGTCDPYVPEEREDEKDTDGIVATRVEEPIEDRLRRAYLNGFNDGAQRASWGRWDHS